jgi:hypothetical protein
MAKTYPSTGQTRLWGVSMTIAAIILGLYLISLFYSSVVHEAERISSPPTEHALNQK